MKPDEIVLIENEEAVIDEVLIDETAEAPEETDAESECAENVGEPEAEEIVPDANEIAYLKAELDSLRRELSESKAFYERLESECAEFSELYPDTPLSTLPDSIWQSVRKGVPLAAAYALEVRRAERESMRARAINGDNRSMSSGSLTNDSRNDFFTPAQVRAMSPAEVRANYTKIVNSMSKWH